MLKTALEHAIFNTARFASIATDEKGVFHPFNPTPAYIGRAKDLSSESGTPVAPVFEAPVFTASGGLQDSFQLILIHHKDGKRLPLLVSLTALREVDGIIGGRLRVSDNAVPRPDESLGIAAGALQKAIFDRENFFRIAADAKGTIQLFNAGAESMLGCQASELTDKITAAGISDPQEMIERAEDLSREAGCPIPPGFEAPVFKASRAIEDAIFNSGNFSGIATDRQDRQLFSVGAERVLGYKAKEEVAKLTPNDLADPQEVVWLVGFETLISKPSRGMDHTSRLQSTPCQAGFEEKAGQQQSRNLARCCPSPDRLNRRRVG
jgi:hypothetical protein